MSEPKLCPFRKHFNAPSALTNAAIIEWQDEFAPCLQEKCAMWHPARHVVVPESPPAHEYDIPGYCGIGGKP